MDKRFGKPKLDEACEAWKDFKDIKRDKNEAQYPLFIRTPLFIYKSSS